MSNQAEVITKAMFFAYELYGKEANEIQIKAYVAMLGREDPEALRNAFMDHINDPIRGRWFPLVADIRAQMAGTVEQAQDEAEEACLTTWEKNNLSAIDQQTRRKNARTAARVEYGKQMRAARGRAPTPAQQIGQDTTEQARIAPTKQAPAPEPEKTGPSQAEVEGRSALKSLLEGMK